MQCSVIAWPCGEGVFKFVFFLRSDLKVFVSTPSLSVLLYISVKTAEGRMGGRGGGLMRGLK